MSVNLFGEIEYGRMKRTAEISVDGRYRYVLRRTWKTGGNGEHVTFVMLNPSTADHEIDDPTIRRCIGFTKTWGYSGLSVRNLFSFRATDPKELLNAEDPVGPRGNVEVLAALTADLVIVAWGTGVPFNRDRIVLGWFRERGTPLFCLGTAKSGDPRHPLYVRAGKKPEPYFSLKVAKNASA